MQAIFTKGRTNARLTSRVLAVVFALWLNLAVGPCAMAFSVDSDCPHCPPPQEDSMAAHHGGHGDEAEPGCDSQPTDCGDIDDFSFDGRSSPGKLKDTTDSVAIVPATLPEVTFDPVAHFATAADPPGPTAAPLPLHLLNCVFLI